MIKIYAINGIWAAIHEKVLSVVYPMQRNGSMC